MTEDLKKVYGWNPAQGDYKYNDALEDRKKLNVKLRKEALIHLLLFSATIILLAGSIIYLM